MCDDQWDDKDAKVVCGMLGFNSGTGIKGHTTKGSPFGNLTRSNFIMDEVKCTGKEHSILDCQHETTHDCGRGEGAGVRCSM